MLDKLSLNKMSYEQKLLLYAGMEHDYINIEAVFSDETENYVTQKKLSGKLIYNIKIRTAKDGVDCVYMHSENATAEKKLTKTLSGDIFDYYEADVDPSGLFKYYFKLIKNGHIYYYNKRGLFREPNGDYDFMLVPGFEVPKWSKGAVIYQIFVDRFCNGDKTNDVVNNEYLYMGRAAKHVDNWYRPVENDDICNFYGGDLRGIMNKMSYLKGLGVDVIFLNPIFVSPSNHKYDIQDYDYIDPHYGVIPEDGGSPLLFGNFRNKYATKYIQRTTNKENLEASNEFFAKFIACAHDNGIRVLLDGVFNHCGAFNKWLDREGFYNASGYPAGAYRDKASPYHKFFRWYADEWPNNDAYDCWWKHDNHPKLNYEDSKELYNYILQIGKKWVSPPYNADGWRLDVAADLGFSKEFNHRFWRDFRIAVKQANPEAIILAEQYGSAEDWLKGDQWDTIMNYDAFMEPITWFLTGMEKHSEEFKGDMLCNAMAFEAAMRYHMARMPVQSLQTSMNELSNHDHSRFLTRTNMSAGRLHTHGADAADAGVNKAIMREAVVFQMTWPGAPTIYYGDEAGLCGWTDPDDRRTYPWGKEDMELIAFHREMVSLHKSFSCLADGSLEYLHMDYGIISYGRWNKNERIVVALNNNSMEHMLRLPVWKINAAKDVMMKRLIITNESGYNTDVQIFRAIDGIIDIILPPYGSIVLEEV